MGLNKGDLLALRQSVWVAPFDAHPDLKFEIVPGAQQYMIGLGLGDDVGKMEFCKQAFINFEGFYDGDEPIENSLEERMFLMSQMDIRTAILLEIRKPSARIFEGEDGAGSV